MEKQTFHPGQAGVNSASTFGGQMPQQFNSFKEQTMSVDTVEIKVNGKEVKLGQDKKTKTDFQKKPKFLGLYFNSNGGFIEQTDAKTEQELKENLLVLQGRGNPNATVVIYAQGSAHKIKQQFDTVK